MMSEQGSDRADATVLIVTGMACDGCADAVTRVLSRIPGVREAKVDFASGRATVTGEAAVAALIAAIETAGYQARNAAA